MLQSQLQIDLLANTREHNVAGKWYRTWAVYKCSVLACRCLPCRFSDCLQLENAAFYLISQKEGSFYVSFLKKNPIWCTFFCKKKSIFNQTLRVCTRGEEYSPPWTAVIGWPVSFFFSYSLKYKTINLLIRPIKLTEPIPNNPQKT